MDEKNASILCIEREKCCGCGACEAMCPRNAIRMQLDPDGFYYPAVDLENCVECGICVRACISNN